MVTPNTTVVLKCRPPHGSPRPNITWYKIGKPSLSLGRGGRRRIRLTFKKYLIIKRVQMGDSGEYQCVARNMAARRVGPIMKLDVRGLSFRKSLLESNDMTLQSPSCQFCLDKPIRTGSIIERYLSICRPVLTYQDLISLPLAFIVGWFPDFSTILERLRHGVNFTFVSETVVK